MSTSTPDKGPQNEACKPCRQIKRACKNDGNKGVCTRCSRLSIECEYGQAKRGRKAGEPQAKRQRGLTSSSAEPSASGAQSEASPDRGTSPHVSTSAAAAPLAHASDWLYRDLHLHAQNGGMLQSEEAHAPVASTSQLNPPQSETPALPNFVLPPEPEGSPAAASAKAPAQPSATGGFSLRKLLGTRAEDEQVPRTSLADAFAVEEDMQPSRTVTERVFDDIAKAGICPEEAVDELFAFYYEHLNPMTSILDPALHTKDWVRSHSPFLFSAILAVATKVLRPSSYGPSFRFCNALFGQAFEHGVCSVELVQALATFLFWIDTTDPSGAAKLAYAIRSAMDCGMHRQKKRPLPRDEYQARLTLSAERTWFYLTIADHRFSNQRSMPCQIPISLRPDAISWILEHSHFPCPSEAGLAPLVALSRLLDLYNALINPENKELPNRTLVAHLADASSTWAKHWSVEENAKTRAIKLLPAQLSLVRFYGYVFRFQLDELYLLLAVSSPNDTSKSLALAFDPMASPILMFGRCVRSALDVLECFREELRVLKYCFDSIFIGAASSAIWLAENIKGAAPSDRLSILASLRLTETANREASSGPQTMPAYMARLTAHLLKKAEAAAAAAALSEAPPDHSRLAHDIKPATTREHGAGEFEMAWSGGGAAPEAGMGGAGLRNGNGPPGGFPSWSSSGASAGVPALVFGGVGASAMMSNQLQPDYLGNNPFFGSMLKPLQPLGEDELIYPADDDLLWQSLFPFYGTGVGNGSA